MSDERVGFVVLCLTVAFVGYLQSICVAPSWRRARCRQGADSELLFRKARGPWREFASRKECRTGRTHMMDRTEIMSRMDGIDNMSILSKQLMPKLG
jgi:hypothetical protein